MSRAIGQFLLGVGVLDASALVAAIGHPLAGAAVAVGAAGIALKYHRRESTHHAPEIKGWGLMGGVELTNPDEPVKVDQVILQDKALALGVMALGSPGSGKSESFSLGLIHHYNHRGGWAYFDGKGQLDLLQKAEAAGVVPDYLFSSDLAESHTINLMDSVDTASIIERLSNTLIDQEKGNDFYVQTQLQVLNRVVPVLCGLGHQVTLRDLFTFLTVQEAAWEVINMAKEQGLSEDVVCLAEDWVLGDQAERANEIKGMINRLFPFVIGPGAERINAYHPDIRLHEVVNQGQSIYFHLPLSQMAKCIAVMVIEELAGIAKSRQTTGPDGYPLFAQVYDDWGGMVHGGFTTYTARCRSAKMPPSFTFQSPAQLEALGPEFRAQLDDTVAVKIIFRVMSERTAAIAAGLVGQYETVELGRNVAEERGRALNVHAVDKMRVNKDLFYELDAGQAVIATLESQGRRVKRRLYKADFPLLNTEGWESITPRPVERQSPPDPRPPLHLYDRYVGGEDIACQVAGEAVGVAPEQDSSPEPGRPEPSVTALSAADLGLGGDDD